MLTRLQQGDAIPPAVADKRIAMLLQHQQQLYEQRRLLDSLLEAVEQKLEFYAQYQSNAFPEEK
jgi:hypothetical protein